MLVVNKFSQSLFDNTYICPDIDECALGLDNCHDTLATCTDVIGAEDSFLCTCNPGYTGSGVTCTTTVTSKYIYLCTILMHGVVVFLIIYYVITYM